MQRQYLNFFFIRLRFEGYRFFKLLNFSEKMGETDIVLLRDEIMFYISQYFFKGRGGGINTQKFLYDSG